MPIEFEMSVVAVAGSLRMTIPKPVARALKLKAGDKVVVTLDDATMEVKRKRSTQ